MDTEITATQEGEYLSFPHARFWNEPETDPLLSSSPVYDDEPEEPDYDPQEPEGPDDFHGASIDDAAVGENPDALLTTGERGIVESGDPSAAANRSGKDKAPKDKKIPNDKRQTTPYMTKYERARILGTRALQIRYVLA